MHGFTWKDGILHVDAIPVPEIAEAVETPTYVYSATAIRRAFEDLRSAFEPLAPKIHYAVKASPNLHLCGLIRGLGAGMDVVSGGEMERAWLAGCPMEDIVFAGVGKTKAEIRAALDGGASPVADVAARFGRAPAANRGQVGLFNVESESEVARISRVARELGKRARAAVRVNPNVDPHTHEYTTTGKQENKFGIDADQIVALFDRWRDDPGIDLVGLHVHIGSPVPKVEPYVEAIQVLLTLIDDLESRGHRVEILDLGGGWPVAYQEGEVPPLAAYGEAIVPVLRDRVAAGLQVCLEPGRSILGNSGILVTRVQHVKKGRVRTFVICDGGMQTLIRPSLYRAFHFIWPVAWDGDPPELRERPEVGSATELVECDVVGPICETGDFLARGRFLPLVEQDDLLAVFSAGAYGMSMASNYNDHGRPAEVLVDGERVYVVNERQILSSLLETERVARELDLAVAVADE